MKTLFGTDGVRGEANSELTPFTALRLGRAAAQVLPRKQSRARVVVGRDTRVSGDMLEMALVSGLLSGGADVILLDVVPTPAVSYLTQSLGADAGVVISASHNPAGENGIKFFADTGLKLLDAVEAEIEALVPECEDLSNPVGPGIGTVEFAHRFMRDYEQHVKGTISTRLNGLSIVTDCANGASSECDGSVFSELGASVLATCCTPDGLNINADCGALYPNRLQRAVVERGASLGVSFDGDADRAIFCDEKGRIIDGDFVMAICGLHWAGTDRLPGRLVVGTVMSNLGLEHALARKNVKLIRTQVGDRYVAEEMIRTGAGLGGEKSGHMIFSRYERTGDGLVTALQVMQVMVETGKPLSELADQMKELPQRLVNVKVRERDGWDLVPEIRSAIKEAEISLDGDGRILVRPSGTEKILRVMVECSDEQRVEQVVSSVADVIRTHLG